ncbi:MAG: M28 family peptidase [Chloroflexi bacterium]|nr:M28 family peptidase [Chloroflexota bacterium]
MTSNNPYLPIDKQIVGDIYTTSEVMDNLTVLCDEFGSRFGGTEGERLSAEFMQRKLVEYGLDVHLEEIHYEGWRRGEVSLEIISPIQKSIPCITLPHSPPANLEAILVDMDEGVPEDFAARADEISGKIVMASSEVNPGKTKRWVHRNEKYGRSLLAGAVGFIFVNHYPGFGPATGGIGELSRGGLIPGISISYEDGAFLQRLIKRHGEVTIRVKSSDVLEPMVSWNVIAELPGKVDPEQVVMLGSHYDGHDISQGAADPASGTVAVIEAARVLAKYAPDLPYTVRFALWGVEEIGLIGSIQYVAAHESDMEKLRFYLNMDMAGAINPKDIVLNKWPELAPIFEGWSEEMALEFKVGQSVNAHSDHYPFLMAGFPTGGIGSLRRSKSGGRGYGHTKYDTLDKVQLTSLREAAVLSARLALRIATQETWPAYKRSKDDVTAVLDNPDNREETAIFEKIYAFYEANK